MIYLLDTNVWIVLLRKALRKKFPQVLARFNAKSPAEIRACSVVVAELRHGAAKSVKPLESRTKVDALLKPVKSLSFDDDVVDTFVAIRRHLESLGQIIGPYDTQIAAIALANGCVLVTNNTNEFKRVPGLKLEDWQI